MTNLDIVMIVLFCFGVTLLLIGLKVYYNHMKKSYDELENIFVDFGNNLKKSIEEYYSNGEED